jgi:isopropylmalate/homocitrate/citramalate synthase
MSVLGTHGIDSIAAANSLVIDPADRIAHPITLCDDTLRDGEQTVGVAFSVEQKVTIAKMLLDAGITHFTVGMPAVSEPERDAARAIRALGAPTAGLYPFARALRSDIEVSMSCGYENIALFIPISDLHLEYKLKLSEDGAFAKMVDAIALARSYGLRVRFGFEDLTRAPLPRIKRFVAGAIEAGASAIAIADTVGILTPFTTYGLVAQLVPITGEIPLLVHFHDDLGMATANSLVACIAGASHVASTLCGLGERTGNTCIEEVAVALRVKYGVDTGVDLAKLTAAAERVAQMAQFPVAFNKPIIGKNAFSTETGIHVHGMLGERTVYETFPPELVGRRHEIHYGKHSGLSNIEYLAKTLSIDASAEAMQRALALIKASPQPTSHADAASILRDAIAATAALAERAT